MRSPAEAGTWDLSYKTYNPKNKKKPNVPITWHSDMLNITTGLSRFIHLKVIWEMWNADLDDFLWDGSIKELNFLE